MMDALAPDVRPGVLGVPDARGAAEVAARNADAVDRDARFPAEAVAALREAGLLGAQVPEPFGGAGFSLRQIGAVAAQLARGCAATGMVFAMHQIQVACLIRHAGAQPALRRLLADVAAGQLLLASVTSEIGIGGDIRRSRCAVERQDQKVRLRKEASVVSYGAEADGFLITARAEPRAAPNAQVLVAVRRAQVRCSRTGGWDTLGMRGTCSDGYVIEADAEADQVFAEPFAEIIAATMLPVSHLLWACVWFGIAQDALARARAYLRARLKAEGRPPQAVSLLPDAVSRMRMLHAALRSNLAAYEACADSGGPVSMNLAADLTLLKTTMSEGCLTIAQAALGITGFAGYRNGTPHSVGRQLRDLQSAPLMINNARIGETMSNMLLLSPMQFELE